MNEHFQSGFAQEKLISIHKDGANLLLKPSAAEAAAGSDGGRWAVVWLAKTLGQTRELARGRTSRGALA